MTKATKFTATAPNGTIVTRSSKTKTYAFAIIVRDSYEIALASAQRAGDSETTASNFAHYRAYLDGTSRFLAKSNWQTDEQHAEQVARDVERARVALKGAEDVAAYRAAIKAEAIARVEARKAAGEFDSFGAFAWSSRLDLAQKAANEARSRGVFAEIHIVPVN